MHSRDLTYINVNSLFFPFVSRPNKRQTDKILYDLFQAVKNSVSLDLPAHVFTQSIVYPVQE